MSFAKMLYAVLAKILSATEFRYDTEADELAGLTGGIGGKAALVSAPASSGRNGEKIQKSRLVLNMAPSAGPVRGAHITPLRRTLDEVTANTGPLELFGELLPRTGLPECMTFTKTQRRFMSTQASFSRG
jgi:hypothetical protein